MAAFDIKEVTSGMTPQEIGDSLRSGRTAKGRTEMKAITGLTAGDVVYLSEGGRSGTFEYLAGDYSAEVAADTLEGVYVALDGVAATVGVLKRRLNGYVTPEMFGAVGTPDESLEIIACATYSGSSKVPTYLNRMYRSSTTVTFDSCAVYSRLCGGIEATTQGSGAIILTGSSPSAIGLLKTYTGANVRSSSDNSHGIFLTSATNAIVSSCYVSGASGAGILSRGCSNVSVYGNTVRDTLADGIHFTGGTTKFIAAGNMVDNTGDDGIACVSYVSDSNYSGFGTISGNKVSNTGARGISCAGSRDLTITGNSINSVALAGVLINSDNTYNTMAPINVTVASNVIDDCGSASGTIQPAIVVFARSGYVAKNIIIRGNNISSSRYRGLGVGTSAGSFFVENVDVSGNNINGCSAEAAIFQGVASLKFNSNSIYETQGAGVVVDGCTGVTSISNNNFTDVNISGSAANDVIQYTNGYSYDRISICNNLHSNPGAYVVDRMISCLYDDAVVFGNISDENSILGSGLSGKARYNRTRRECEMTSVPTSGIWDSGDFVWDVTGSNLGWLCTTSGDFSGTPPVFSVK